jgi:hypothetical protein
MSDTLYVTPAQVLAVKLAIQLSEEDGDEPDEALRAIANAQVLAEESAPTEEMGVAEPAEGSLQQAGSEGEGNEQARQGRLMEETATDHAVILLNQAQQLANSMIDEAMQSARELLLTARAQQRTIIEQAKVTAQETINQATAIAERAGSENQSVHDIESIKTFAKLVQAQAQVVLDALNEQGRQLDAEPLRSDRGSKIAS